MLGALSGFAIATGWVPDVLILHEVLSVGDARFLRRSERRMEEFRKRGTTVLMVSRAVEAVRESCQRAIWLDKGRVEADGPAGEVVDRYPAFSAIA